MEEKEKKTEELEEKVLTDVSGGSNQAEEKRGVLKNGPVAATIADLAVQVPGIFVSGAMDTDKR